MRKIGLYHTIYHMWFKLLCIGAFLYLVTGVAHCLLIDKVIFIPYYFATTASMLATGFFSKKFLAQGPQTPAIAVWIACVMAFTCSFLVAYLNAFTIYDLVFLYSLVVATMDVTWIMPKKLIYLQTFIGLLILFIPVLFTSEIVASKWPVVIPILMIMAWKLSNSLIQHKAFTSEILASKDRAYKATTATLNHEFNNVATVILPLLQTKDFKNSENDLKMLEKNLNKLIKLIDQVSHQDKFEEDTYARKIKMVKLS